jgi:hypothetical protein
LPAEEAVNGDGLDDLIILSLYDKDDRNNSDEASRTYVVFGKINETVVDLSTIRSSSDGFIINGEMSETISGISASSAGDVNGDGLDDLIVGVHIRFTCFFLSSPYGTNN